MCLKLVVICILALALIIFFDILSNCVFILNVSALFKNQAMKNTKYRFWSILLFTLILFNPQESGLMVSSKVITRLLTWRPKFKTPCGHRSQIRSLCCIFLLKGYGQHKGLHLLSWKKLIVPKDLGGWGLKDGVLYSKAFAEAHCGHASRILDYAVLYFWISMFTQIPFLIA